MVKNSAKNKILVFCGSIIYKIKIYANRMLSAYHRYQLAECGDNVSIGYNCEFSYKNINIGNDVFIGNNCCLNAAISRIYIGNHVMLAPHVTIRGGDHRVDLLGKYIIEVKEGEKKPENDQDVIIEDDVWIGTNVTILKGVKIGRGSVIGAGSVVVRNIPPYTIRVGVHGVLQKPRFTNEEIVEHERLIRINNIDADKK